MTELCLEARGMEKVGSSLIQLMIGISLICGIEAIRRRLGPMRAAETVRPAQAREPAHVSQANVDLYLRVMRATAERARNPAPQDLTTMAAFRRIRYGPRSAATKLRPEEQEIVQRALLLMNALDEIVAREKHVDTNQYRGAKAAVESVLPCLDQHHRDLSGVVTPEEWQALKSKGAALAPWAREVRQLQSAVWGNPLRQSFAENEPRTSN
jgi:hypothetical protein